MALRKVQPLKMPDIVPAQIDGSLPVVEWVAPGSLFVDEDYQRGLGERSVTLIRKIVANWSWKAFKPPICARVADALHVVDGQHTAIAAATHPQIDAIPVIVVPPGSAQDYALAFVRHNRDRLQVTATQLHVSLVAAGDDDALTIHQVCAKAGVRVLKNSPGMGRFRPGDTMAVAAIGALISRRHAMGARQVLEVLADAKVAPVAAALIRAVEELMFADAYAGQLAAPDIATTIRDMDFELEREAKRAAAELDLPMWKAMTIILFKKTRKTRRGHPAAA